MELRNPGKRDIVLGAVVPSMQTEARYRQDLAKAIANMTASYEYWLRAKYRRALDVNMAAGRLPDAERAEDADTPGPGRLLGNLFKELARLREHWEKHFDALAARLAPQSLDAMYRDNTFSWGSKLKRAGFDINLQLTPAQQTILKAKVPENVALIRSIQQDYHKDIEGIVSRNFLKGRDLSTMADEIKGRAEVSTRRAALIARDQSNKATAQMNAARQQELGLNWATWLHSSAGKEPRRNHVKAGREQWIFDTQAGIDFGDSFGQVLPGEAINCFPGDSEIEFATGCKRLWRRRYSGILAVITTETGETFRATPNHPVLTTRGWIGAGSLNLGDHVLKVAEKVGQLVKVNVQHGVTRFDELFSAAAAYITPMRTAGAAAQFHGDGAAGDIDVVNVDSFLPDNFDAALCQQVAELIFADPDAMVYAATLGTDGALAQALRRMTIAPDGVIRCASALLPLLKGHARGADAAGRRLVAWLHAQCDEAFANGAAGHFVPFAQFQFTSAVKVRAHDLIVGQLFNMLARWQGEAASADDLAQRLLADAGGAGDFRDAVPGFQQLERVVDLRFEDYDGHVYNLENSRNWYSAGTYIVHNCRCHSRTIIPALGRGGVKSLDDLEPVPGFPGAYRAKKGTSAGEQQKQDVVFTRSPAGSPVKYS